MARIDAARLDGAQLLGIGAEIFVDIGLTPRQRQMLIARAAVSNRPGYPHEHTRCRRDAAGRCALCLKGPGPGLAAADGRWFDDATFTWRDPGGGLAAPVPPDDWRFVAMEPIAVGDADAPQRRCASCAARSPDRARERSAAGRSRQPRWARRAGSESGAAVGANATDAGDSREARDVRRAAGARCRSTQLALDLAPRDTGTPSPGA